MEAEENSVAGLAVRSIPPSPLPTAAEDALSLHARLRVATQPVHSSLDHLMTQLDLNVARDYACLLGLNASALESLRPYWRRADTADFTAMLASLHNDLAILGVTRRDLAVPIWQPINGLGLAYVVRGSRLGSKVLRKRVGSGLPTAYLDLRLTLNWHELLAELEAPRPVTEQDAIIAGAKASFSVFDLSARAFCGARP